MPIPALIEYQGSIHFSLVGEDGFNLICPVASNKVRQIGTPPPTITPGYVLLACGKVVEATLRASGQWQPVLEFMSAQMQHAVLTRTPALKKKYLRQQEKMKQYDMMGLLYGCHRG